MRRLRILITCLCVALASLVAPRVGWAARDGTAEVLDVRVAPHDGGITRFVLELSDPIPFTVSIAAGGVAIDTPALDWRGRAAGLVRPVGLINSFTYATPKPGSGRLFLDTGGGASVDKAFIMPGNSGDAVRLVVDLAVPDPPPAPQYNANPLLGHGRPPEIASAAMLAPPRTAVPSFPSIPSSNFAGAPEPVEAALRGLPDRKQERTKPIVVLDPGHGGVDPGTVGLNGEFEKEIVLDLALTVKERLDKDGKVRCLLTRDSDVFVPLPDRVAIARAAKADLFMSLHADSEADPEIRGLSVYTLSKTASDAAAEAIADKENKADLVGGLDLVHANPEVTSILIDLVQRETLNLSAVFASLVIDEVGSDTHILLQNAHRFAGFAVLKAADVPSVLVETGYLSNRQDEQLLRRPEYRAKLAAALARAIERYFARTHTARHL